MGRGREKLTREVTRGFHASLWILKGGGPIQNCDCSSGCLESGLDHIRQGALITLVIDGQDTEVVGVFRQILKALFSGIGILDLQGLGQLVCPGSIEDSVTV